MSPEPGTLADTEPHPAAQQALAWIQSQGVSILAIWAEALASSAIENNRTADICSETLRRIMAGEPVSDRYVLGLAWVMRNAPLQEGWLEGLAL